MEMSDAGLRLIEQQEGFAAQPSQNVAGVWTIGFGHTYGVDAHTSAITEAQAVDLLIKDVAQSYGVAINALGLPLTQNQFDATCSFVYQLGTGVLGASSPFGSYLRARDWLAAANAMVLYDQRDGVPVPDLRWRRATERALFLAPAAVPPSPLDVLNRVEREAVDQRNGELEHPRLEAEGLAKLEAQLVVLRQQVWLAAIKGLEPDGSPTRKGWDVDLRAPRYDLLGKLTGWNP
jgi:lysozyme